MSGLGLPVTHQPCSWDTKLASGTAYFYRNNWDNRSTQEIDNGWAHPIHCSCDGVEVYSRGYIRSLKSGADVAHKIAIGVIGMGWMGHVHSRSYLQIPLRFPESDIEPRLVICGDDNERLAQQSRATLGFGEATNRRPNRTLDSTNQRWDMKLFIAHFLMVLVAVAIAATLVTWPI